MLASESPTWPCPLTAPRGCDAREHEGECGRERARDSKRERERERAREREQQRERERERARKQQGGRINEVSADGSRIVHTPLALTSKESVEPLTRTAIQETRNPETGTEFSQPDTRNTTPETRHPAGNIQKALPHSQSGHPLANLAAPGTVSGFGFLESDTRNLLSFPWTVWMCGTCLLPPKPRPLSSKD